MSDYQHNNKDISYLNTNDPTIFLQSPKSLRENKLIYGNREANIHIIAISMALPWEILVKYEQLDMLLCVI